jgi:hypothetical protein
MVKMKALLDNLFAPITFTCGFVESSFDRFSQAFAAWQTDLDARFNTRTEMTRFVAPSRKPCADLSRSPHPLTATLWWRHDPPGSPYSAMVSELTMFLVR